MIIAIDVIFFIRSYQNENDIPRIFTDDITYFKAAV